MQQIYGRTPIQNCDFIEIAVRYGSSPVNLLHIFRTPFLKNTSGGLLLQVFETIVVLVVALGGQAGI